MDKLRARERACLLSDITNVSVLQPAAGGAVGHREKRDTSTQRSFLFEFDGKIKTRNATSTRRNAADEEQLDETVSSRGSSSVFLQRRHEASQRDECSLHSTTKLAFTFSFPARTRLLAEVKHCHAHLQRRCIIPSVAYQSSPLPLSGLFHRNFNFGGALARLMQFRFLTPPQQEEAASQQVGAKTTGLRCFSISHPLLSSPPRLRLLVIYLLGPAACEPPPPSPPPLAAIFQFKVHFKVLLSSSIFTAPLLAIICHASATESTDGQTDGRRRRKLQEVPAISGAGFLKPNRMRKRQKGWG